MLLPGPDIEMSLEGNGEAPPYVKSGRSVLEHPYSILVVLWSAVKAAGTLWQYKAQTHSSALLVCNVAFVEQAVRAKCYRAFLFCSVLFPPRNLATKAHMSPVLSFFRVWKAHYFILARMDSLRTSSHLSHCCAELPRWGIEPSMAVTHKGEKLSTQ